jgi:hypothetical protein
MAERRQNASFGYRQIAYSGTRLLPDASPRASSGDLLGKGLGTADLKKLEMDNTCAFAILTCSRFLMILIEDTSSHASALAQGNVL